MRKLDLKNCINSEVEFKKCQSAVVLPIQITDEVFLGNFNIEADAVDANTDRQMLEELIIQSCIEIV